MSVRFVSYDPAHVIPGTDEIRDMLDRFGQATVVVPSTAERTRVREGLARVGVPLGVDVLTPASLVESYICFAGVGRKLADAVERRLMVARLLEQDTCPLTYNPGTVRVLARAAGASSAALAVAGRGDLTEVERHICDFMAGYLDACKREGLIDLPEATALMVEDDSLKPVLARHPLVLQDIASYPDYLVRLVAATAAASEVVVLVSPWQTQLAHDLASRLASMDEGLEVGEVPEPMPGSDRVPCDVRLAAVSGPSARAEGYAALVREQVDAGATDILVCAPDPLAAARSLAQRLAHEGVDVTVEGKLALGSSVAGEQLLALDGLARLMRDAEPGVWWPAPQLVDWLRSPVCGVPSRTFAMRFARTMAQMRTFGDAATGDWAVTPELALDLLEREAKRTCSELERREVSCEPEVAFGVPRALYAGNVARAIHLLARGCEAASCSSFGAGATFAQQSSEAITEVMHDVSHKAARMGASPQAGVDVMGLVQARVAANLPHTGEGGPRARVVVCDLASASSCAPGSFDALVCLDVDSQSYSLADRDDPVRPLERGCACDTVHAYGSGAHRDQFYRAFHASRGSVTLARVTHDVAGDETYAALVWDESAKAGAVTREVAHEGTLFDNVCKTAGADASRHEVALADPWHLDGPMADWLLTDARATLADGEIVARPASMSASQIESLLACPMGWLVGNRVGKVEVRSGFTPVERGTFVHDVMQRLHVITAPGGVCEGQDRKALIDEVFWQMAREHRRGRHASGPEPTGRVQSPYVPLTSLERAQMEQLLAVLREAVAYEADVLGSFEPSLFEYSFDKAGVTYAGRRLGGRIDRVDIGLDHDGTTRLAAVIDYKHRRNLAAYSLKDPTMTLGEDEELADDWVPQNRPDESPKVQTLVYARAVERALAADGPIHAVAALYFGTSGPVMNGAASDVTVDRGELDGTGVSSFPGKAKRRTEHEGSMTFEELMDRTEKSVRSAFDDIASGDVEPDELTGACAYCPLLFCERRH